MYRIFYIAGALVLWAIVYQGVFRYEYTMQNGYAVQRRDRLTGTTCGIPQCLPPTPTPVPKPTVFDPQAAYSEWNATFTRQAHQALALVKKTQFAQELTRSQGADKFAWIVSWSSDADEHIFALHDPRMRHALPITQDYIDSLGNPKNNVKVVCFCNGDGAGFRWEVHLKTQQVLYVNDNPALQRKYSLVDV